MVWLIALTLLVLLSLLGYLQPDYFPRLLDRLRCRTPPGPFSFPIVGAPMGGLPPWKTMDRWGKQYGGMFSLFLGSEYTVVLTDLSIVKQVLNNPVFDGRPWNVALRPVITECKWFL